MNDEITDAEAAALAAHATMGCLMAALVDRRLLTHKDCAAIIARSRAALLRLQSSPALLRAAALLETEQAMWEAVDATAS